MNFAFSLLRFKRGFLEELGDLDENEDASKKFAILLALSLVVSLFARNFVIFYIPTAKNVTGIK